ncbi:hypothetical protein [Streptomyces sp. NPDC060001]|uniref:hypothetical protein n=1 Tax=Streptomyces sp. NPDC060001 TaxID=3347032 RepID=UPI0036737AE6
MNQPDPTTDRRNRYAQALHAQMPGCEHDIHGHDCRTLADAVLAVADAEQAAVRATVCICGHDGQRHFEDACLVCDCGDYLTGEAAREVIERWRTAAVQARADRAADRQQIIEALYEARRPGLGGMSEADAVAYMADAVLRRLAAVPAAEEQPADAWDVPDARPGTTDHTLQRVKAAEEQPDNETPDAPPREPHPTEADQRHALTVLARIQGRDAAGPAVVPQPEDA